LLAYAIEAAKKSKEIDRIIVSTDSDLIAAVARYYGAEIVKRPRDLARDNVTLDPVVFHAVKTVESREGKPYQFILTINPTSPLITSKTIDRAINIMKHNNYDTLISVKNETHLYWKKHKGKFVPINEKRANRQYLDPIYKETGAILISRREIITAKNRLGKKIFFLETPPLESIDIDSYQDWWLCEKILKRLTVLFRVEGNRNIGLGHVCRATTIARQLSFDHNVVFLVSRKSVLGINKIKEDNYRIFTFSKKNEELIALNKINPDIVINDILDTSAAYMYFLKRKKYFVVNFEDLGRGAEWADILINALYKMGKKSRNHYYGYRYYCPREDFSIFPNPVLRQHVKEILITFGGIDANDLTARTLEVIESLNMKDININIILGLGYAPWKKLNMYVARLIKNGFKVSLKRNVKIMILEMKRADIIVTSNGRTVYEAAQLAIPYISIAQNAKEEQHPLVSDKITASYLGRAQNVSKEAIAAALGSLIRNYSLRKKMHLSLKRLKLNTGTDRVVKLIYQNYYNNKGKYQND